MRMHHGGREKIYSSLSTELCTISSNCYEYSKDSHLAGTACSLHQKAEAELDNERQTKSTTIEKKRRNYFYFEVPEIQQVNFKYHI